MANTLVLLKEYINGKRRGKLTRRIVLLHGNAFKHTSNFEIAKLKTMRLHLFNKSSHTPDLAFSDYFFSKLEEAP